MQTANSDSFVLLRGGLYLYSLATIAAGVLDLIWGEFEAVHQPIGALGDNIPGHAMFAYITAVGMILAGAAILWRRTVPVGALATSFVYLVFALFWLPRFYTVPQFLGFRLTLFIGLLAGVFTQLIAMAGGLILFASVAPPSSTWRQRSPVVARWIFGLGSILFGLSHLTSVQDVARMMPGWMPAGGSVWVILTGIAFLLAGLAILSRILNVLAAHLLTLMLLFFELALIPVVFANPQSHIAWGSNAYSLAAAGAVWIFAVSITTRDWQREHPA